MVYQTSWSGYNNVRSQSQRCLLLLDIQTTWMRQESMALQAFPINGHLSVYPSFSPNQIAIFLESLNGYFMNILKELTNVLELYIYVSLWLFLNNYWFSLYSFILFDCDSSKLC